MSKKIRVFIVDDSALVRQILTRMIKQAHDMELVGSAQDPMFALKKMEKDWPDVITLDVEMPRMDGLEFLRKIMTDKPTPVVMCSTRTSEGSRESLEAMRIGAIDVVEKPKINIKTALADEEQHILGAIRVAAKANLKTFQSSPNKFRSKTIYPIQAPVPKAKENADVMLKRAVKNHSICGQRLIALGTSTGGTKALEDVLMCIHEKNLPPIVIVQHMPEQFTKTFAERLNTISTLRVVEAENGMPLSSGVVYIAPGGRHMLVEKIGATLHVVVKKGPRVNRHCPSIDVLFRSVAKTSGKSALGIIMTGMGDDGAVGLKELKDQGAATFGQNKESCVIYGMPAAAQACGAVDKEIDLHDIPYVIMAFGKNKSDL